MALRQDTLSVWRLNWDTSRNVQITWFGTQKSLVFCQTSARANFSRTFYPFQLELEKLEIAYFCSKLFCQMSVQI